VTAVDPTGEIGPEAGPGDAPSHPLELALRSGTRV